MSENTNIPRLEISMNETGDWGNSLIVGQGKRLDVWYKVTKDADGDIDELRLVFPTFQESNANSIPEGQAIALDNEWNGVELTGSDPESWDWDYEKPDNPIGVIDLRGLRDVDEDFIVFQLSITGAQADGLLNEVAVCKLKQWDDDLGGYVDENEVSISTEVAVDDPGTGDPEPVTLPRVMSYTVDRSVVINNEASTLKWDVKDADTVHVVKESNGNILNKSTETVTNGEFNVGGQTGENTYLLKASNKGNASQKIPSITVLAHPNKTMAYWGNPFDGHTLMGIYNYPGKEGDKLLALVLHNEGQPEADVKMWESVDGLRWKLAYPYNENPTFKTGNPNGLQVPLEFAGSPGVVVDNILYLVGGSRFNPNIRSNAVYSYDFGHQLPGWRKETDAPFTPRMGHACVAKGNEIWVMGGATNQGATKDCYSFNKGIWSSEKNLKRPVCMASAVVSNDGHINLFGGFGMIPGFADQTVEKAQYYDGNWKNYNWGGASPADLAGEISACLTMEIKGALLTLLQRKNVAKAYKITSSKLVYKLTTEVLDDNFYVYQAVTFNDAVWICRLTQGKSIKSNFQYILYSED